MTRPRSGAAFSLLLRRAHDATKSTASDNLSEDFAISGASAALAPTSASAWGRGGGFGGFHGGSHEGWGHRGFGYVAAEFLSPTAFEQLCYVKDASGWKIAGYNGVD